LPTFVNGRDGKTDEDIIHDDHDGTEAVVPREKTRLICLQQPYYNMGEKVDGSPSSIENHIVGV
jgi:hypothetical protein